MSNENNDFEGEIQKLSTGRPMADEQGHCLLSGEGKSPGFLLLIGLIVIVSVIVFFVHRTCLSAKALSFDDDQYLIDNILVQNPSWYSAKRFLTEVLKPSTVGGYYQPLAMISLMLDVAMGGRGDNLVPFHRTSLFLHIANTALIIVLLYLLFRQVWVAAIVGLLFGVHPMTVESIAWIGERKTVLSAFFALWSLIFYVFYARRCNWKFYAGCVFFYVLALMSKPTTTMLPLVMVLMDYWPLRREKGQFFREKISLFVIGAISAIITYISQNRAAPAVLAGGHSIATIPLIICHNIVFYLYKIIWPAYLSSHYPFPENMTISEPVILAGVIGTCILIILILFLLRLTRAPLFGFSMFLIAILPTFQIFRFSNVIASDKFLYLPSIGLLMILAAFLGWLCNKSASSSILSRRCIVVIAVGLVLASGESFATRRNLSYRQDTVSLCRHMLKLTPDYSALHHMLGHALYLEGQLDEAVEEYQTALKLEPNDPSTYNNLGITLIEQGKIDEAIACFNRAIRIWPFFAQVYNNLGLAFNSIGRSEEAISCFLTAIELKPEFVQVYGSLGSVLKSQGKIEEAIQCYQQGISKNPNYAPIHFNLANLYFFNKKMDEALRHYEKAAKLSPEEPIFLNALADTLLVRENPTPADISRAVDIAERAAQLSMYRDATILETLAKAYDASGRLDDAAETIQKAISIAALSGNEELVERLLKKLEDYGKQEQ